MPSPGIIIVDKCDSNWTDEDCPQPPVWAKVHYGQFGHKCLKLYCQRCRDRRYNPKNRTEEENLLAAIFNEAPEDQVWEPYVEAA